MSEKHCYKLILDPEFERMCPPSIGRNHNDIEALIIEHGCPHPIQVWHKVILTDFVYYHICQDWGIEFEIEELSFTSRYDALYYAALHHVNNNTLSDVYHRYIIGKAYHSVKKILLDVNKQRRSNPFPSELMDELKSKGSTYKRNRSSIIVSNSFNVSPMTASEYGRYSTALDAIYDKAPEIAIDILASNFKLSIENTLSISKLSRDEIIVAYDHAKNLDNYTLIQTGDKKKTPIEKKAIPSAPVRRTRKKANPEIKQMPKYDPDAELSSLFFTVPSWISSLQRTINVTDFSNTSLHARWKLEQKLKELSNTIIILEDKLKE